MKLRDIFRRGEKKTKHEKAIERQLRLERKDLKKEEKKRGKIVRKAKVALCLGGGGARGYAHIGAIKAFREAGFDFDLVVGTSVGSIIGGLYAAGISPERMWSYGSLLEVKDIRKGFFFQPDDSRKIAKIITDLAGERNIEDLPKKFAAVATDLVEGRQVILDKGDLGTAVAASSTVPLAFRPLVVGEMHLVDGGLLNNIPADVCRMLGADYVVTVDVNPTRGGGTSELGIIPVLKATFDIMGSNASRDGLINSDVIVAPDLSAFRSSDKTGYEEMYRLGYEAAKAKINEIAEIFKR